MTQPTSVPPITSSPTYQRFLAESPAFSIAAYGRSSALGLKGTVEQINSFHLLVHNYSGPRPLHWLSDDFAYLTMSPALIRAAIRLYLYANVLHSGEVPTDTSWDDAAGVYSLTQDTNLATEIADQCAAAFVAGLKVQSFIPTDRTSAAHEYGDPFARAS